MLFTFPSRYFFAIGHQGVFSLGRWSSLLPTGFPVSRGTLDSDQDNFCFRLQDCHLLRSTFPGGSASLRYPIWPVRNPVQAKPIRFGLFPFRSPLLRESIFLSLPPGTKMFQFPGFPSMPYVFRHGYLALPPGGFPHSDIYGSTPACGSP